GAPNSARPQWFRPLRFRGQVGTNRSRRPLDDRVPQPGHVVVADSLILAPDRGQRGAVGPMDMLHDLGEIASAAAWTLAQRGARVGLGGRVERRPACARQRGHWRSVMPYTAAGTGSTTPGLCRRGWLSSLRHCVRRSTSWWPSLYSDGSDIP